MIAGFAGQFRQASLYERVAVATHLHSAIAQEQAQEPLCGFANGD